MSLRARFTATVLGAVLLVGSLVTGAGAAHADNEITWAVQPSTAEGPDGRDHLEYRLSPGEAVTDYVGVSNLGAETLELTVYAMDAIMTEDGAFTLPPAGTNSKDVGSWVGITGEGSYTIEPGTRLDIPFRLTVPPTASPGDHAGGIVASLATLGTSGEGAQQISVDRRVGVRIYVDVPGERSPEIALEDVTVAYDGGWDLFGGTAEIAYTVVNRGNVRLGANVDLGLTGIFGIALPGAETRAVPELLPGSSVRITERVDGVPPAVVVAAALSAQPVSVGDAGTDTGEPTTAEAQSLALPWLIMIILLVVLILVVGLWWRGRRWRRAAKAALAAVAAGTAAGASTPTGEAGTDAATDNDVPATTETADRASDPSGTSPHDPAP